MATSPRDPKDSRADLIDRILKQKGIVAQKPQGIVRRDPAAETPMSFAQERFFFVDQFEPDSAAFNLTGAFAVEGPLDTDALTRAFEEVGRRHEVLRTTFTSKGGKALQVIHPEPRVEVSQVDLRTHATDIEAEARAEVVREARRPFDLVRGPLIRAKIVRLAEERRVLIYSMHHIVSDVWSMGVLVREIAALYDAFTTGQTPKLPDLPIQYGDYAAWQRESLQGEALTRELSFWSNELRGASFSFDLPADRPRPPQQSVDGEVVKIQLDADLTREVRALAKAEGTTLYAFLLAAFSGLLSRYTGQTDFLIGTPYASRGRPETEGVIGCFISNLVMRARTAENPTFRELLARSKKTSLDAFAHAEVPFERVVEEVRPPRDPSRSPMFQVALTLENLGVPDLTLSNVRMSSFGSGTKTAKYDLMLTVVEGKDTLGCEIEYAVALFDAWRMEALLGHFQNLVRSAVAEPDKRLSDLTLLGAAEHKTLIETWNDTRVELPPSALTHLLFEAQVDETPEATAVVCGDEVLTYQQLDERANQVAQHLATLGVGPDVMVGLCLPRSIELVVGMLGILKAGGAYVPLDPSYPAERLSFMLEDAMVPVVLTNAAIGASLPVQGAMVVEVDTEAETLASMPTDRLTIEQDPNSLAYMIYTSGSTGKPKGAMITHKGLTNYLLWAKDAYRVSSGLGAAVHSSASFDLTVTGLYTPLLVGQKVVLLPEAAEIDALAETLRKNRGLSLVKITPAHLEILNSLLTDEEIPGLVGAFVIGGEALYDSAIERWRRLAPSMQLINEYGPTETVVGCCVFDGAKGKASTATVPIGRPIANTQLYVLDEQRAPVPIGVPGELYIGGHGVARGYWGREELTAERFVSDTFSHEPDAKLYKTGDLVRYLPNGDLEFLGRLDHQVKIRGYRIELGEIEAALGQSPAVGDRAVIAREDTPGDKRLVAYVVPAEGVTLDVNELRAGLLANLPDYMVPSAYVVLDALPLTDNGKLDRAALPAPDAGPVGERVIVMPRSKEEETLLGIWTEVLKTKGFGVTDNFFELGGHSLLATQVLARAQTLLGVTVPLRAFFDAPTIEGMASQLSASHTARGADVPVLAPVPRGGPLPLSFGQERLWFLFQLEPESAFYNIPSGVRLRGPLDVAALEKAFAALVERHEVLRTTYASVSGRPSAIVHERLALPFERVDASHLSETDALALAMREAKADLDRPFDLSKGPILRVKLVKLAHDDYALLVTAHHMVIDIWTQGIMTRDLSELYASFAEGREAALPALTIQYADYAAWQRSYLSGETLERELLHWSRALQGAPTTLDLPTDRPRPPIVTYRGSHATIRFSPERSAQIHEACQREGVTPYMLALATFNVLLYRYTGQEDILVGTSRADRRHPETEPLIGYFLNQIVLRTRLDGAPSFRELLGRVRETTLAAYAHQDMPFERIVELLRPERDMSRSPIFQVMVDAMLVPEPPAMGQVEVSPLMADVETSRFDITLAFAEQASGFVASFEYNADLFDHATMERMLAQLDALMFHGMAAPTTRIADLPLLTDAERASLRAWNDTARDYEVDTTIVKLIEAQVDRTPDAPALYFGGKTLTYRELDTRANKVANWLRNMGAGPEVKVGVCVERSFEMVIGVLGAMKAGAAYVPMDPAWPAERLAFMLEDTQAPFLLVQESVLNLLPALYLQTLCLDSDWDTIDAESEERPESQATGDSLAYIIYTSGSTGKPKGVQVSQSNLVHSTQARLHYYPHKVESFLLLSSFAFDSSMAGIYWTLCQGGTITLPSEDQKEDPTRLATLIGEARVSHLLCVPSLYTFLLNQAKPSDVASLKVVIVAGEAVPLDTVLRHHEKYPEIRLYNEYGPTEASVWCSVYETRANEPGPRVPIGYPIANTALYVLDAAKKQVPVGVPGEVYVSGLGITRGYLNRPELTAEKFVESPFADSPSKILYRTGDLAKYRADGALDFLGRIDQQVKIRGYRIELEEIESVLSTSRHILEGVVIVREDMPGDPRLVAYVVPSEATPPSPSELRSFLGETLPEYMVPSAFVVLSDIPRLPNGKVDRKALPAPDARGGASAELTLPRSPVEDVIAGIWASVLGADQVGVHDSFFELGGHSLLATQVMAKIVEAFAVELPLSVLFDEPTVAALAGHVEDAVREGQGLVAPPIVKVSREGSLPLSFGQERLWILDQIEPDNPFYNLPAAVRLTGALDSDALSAAIAAIVARHEALRTTFEAHAGRPRLVIHEAMDMTPVLEDVSDMDVEAREQVVRDRIASEAAQPFSLAKGPLARTRLLRLDEEEHVLIFTLHHVIADGWSMGILVRELGELYTAGQERREPRLPALALQYTDYAAWQRAFLSGEVVERELEYWRSTLAGAKTVLDLPTDKPRPAVISYRGARTPFDLGPELSKAIADFCRKEGVTLYMVMLASFGALLSRHAGQDDVLIGTSVADRRKAETHDLIGYFLNQLVFRVNLTGAPTFRELCLRVRETALGAYAHQDLPFERLVEHMRVRPDMSRAPLFQVMVDVANAPAEPLRLPGVTLAAIPPEQTTARFDLTLSVSEGKDGVQASIEYATDLFEAATIERLIGRFLLLLKSGVASPERAVSSLPIMADAERHHLLVELNATHADYPRDALIHQLFEAQVDKTPDAPAALCGADVLTYRELDERANQLAQHLATLGVGADVMVGLCLPRCLDLLVGILGILKAGGAYVPLDPSYPMERLSFMLEDAMVPVVVTNAAIGATLPVQGAMVVEIDTESETLASMPTERLSLEQGATSLAYMIYTSGSTGKPKGAMITHRGLVNYLVWAKDAYRVATGAGAVVHSSASFDLTVTGLYTPLLVGKKVVLLPEGAEIDALAEAMRANRGMSLVKITPAHLEILNTILRDEELPGLVGAFVIGGEALYDSAIERWRRLSPGMLLINEYGPTETVVGCCVFDGGQGKAQTATVPIGRPIANTTLYVLDAGMEPLPVGIPGELYIGGDGVARGYWGRDELTRERFVADPFRQEPDARLYKTGDLVRYLANGDLEFLGRLDHQVKLRGYRIELGEIEAALGASPAVGERAVIAREDTPGDKRLVAYVVPAEGAHIDVNELRAGLLASLPEYMVPSAFVILDALPLTDNGKLDRQALPAPERRVQGEEEMVLPRNPTEEVLLDIFMEVLGEHSMGVTDDFFDYGGHSLLGTQVLARVRSRLGADLPFRAIFEAPTVEKLALRIAGVPTPSTVQGGPSLVALPRDQRKDLSFAQERLWFLEQLSPEGSAYNVPEVLRITGDLDAVAFRAALSRVVERHEVLRTGYPTVDGKAEVVVREKVRFELPTEDLRALPREAREKAVAAAAAEEARLPFRVADGPLVRAKLLITGKDEHVLLFTMHHMVTDAWSQGVLFRELSSCYDAVKEGRDGDLPPLTVQYADYATWQREMLSGEHLTAELDHWKKTLAGLPDGIELPTDRPRPALQSFEGAKVSFRVPKALADATLALARSEGATLFMTLLAAFQAVLVRWSGQEDLAIGTPVANRSRPETEALIGLFLNTVVLRVDAGNNPSFRELIQRTKETALTAYAHQEVPFERIVDALQPVRDMSRSPLFQVMFTVQNAPQPVSSVSGIQFDRLAPTEVVAKFDLALSVAESTDGMIGAFEFASALFDTSTIQRMCDHFLVLLAAATGNPSTLLWDLPLMAEAERDLVVRAWNATDRSFAREVGKAPGLHRFFEAEADEHPDRVAVLFEGQSLTYGALERKANQLAHGLFKLGVNKGDLVGVAMERSPELVIALYGILKAGAAYVPIDPGYPAARIAFFAQDSGAQVVLSQGALAGSLPLGSAKVVCLDTGWEAFAGEPETRPDVALAPTDRAYMIYTSGSTGTPKGALNTHAGITNRILWMQDAYHLDANDRVLQKTPYSFDVSVWEFFWPLAVGATLVVARPEGHKDPSYLAEVIAREGISTLHFVPSMLRAFLESGEGGPCPSIKRVMASGEALTPDLVERFFSRFPTAELHNLYGPTEAAVDVTWFPCEASSTRTNVPIGRPIANTQIYMLDPMGQPTPIGVPGELHIGGVQVGAGYWNRPELTEARFVPSPFRRGERLYKTGDRARWAADGQIEYLGRMDFQVKIRGFRIELGEIEAALEKHPLISAAVVVAREDTPGDKRLVAYLVPLGDAPNTADLRAFLSNDLPDYMVPWAYVMMPALPLTSSGKVDRRALPKPEIAVHAHDDAPPRTPAEEILAEAFRSVLRLPKVGIHDNFFELGGDSILSIQIVSRVRQGGLRISPRQMFQYQTVAELAQVAEAAKSTLAEQGVVEGELPLTPIMGWWLEHDLPRPSHWNQAVLLEADGPLDRGAMERAVAHLLRHHDALRLRLERGVAKVSVRLAPVDDVTPVTYVDARGLGDDALLALTETEANRAQASLDIAQGPIVRVVLFDRGDAPFRLLVVVHHLGIDGVSWRILFEDLWAGYEAEKRGESPRLPPKTTSYLTWAKRLAEYAKSDALRTEVPYWASDDRHHVAEIRADHPTGERSEGSATKVVVTLDAQKTGDLLRKAPEAYHTQINDLLLAALLRAFQRKSQKPGLLVAVEGHGREELFDDVDVTRTIGWFTSVAPLLLVAPLGAGDAELIKTVKEELRAVPRGGLGHGILRYLGDDNVRQRLSALPEPQVVFNYLGQLDQALHEDLPLRPVPASVGAPHDPKGKRRYPIDVSGGVQEGKLVMHWSYSPGLHDEATISDLANSFLEELERLVAHCVDPTAGGYTPSDFSKVKLSQAALDAIVSMADDDDDEDEDELA